MGLPWYLARSSAAREREVVWRVMQRLLKQDWGHANVVWDHTIERDG